MTATSSSHSTTAPRTAKQIGLIVLCSLLVYALIVSISTTLRSGRWAEWQSLGTPPAGATEIVGIGLSSTTRQVDVFVKSSSGRVSHRNPELINSWEEVNYTLGFPTEVYQCDLGSDMTLPRHSDSKDYHRISINGRSDIIDCAAMVWGWEWGADEVTYIALTQGQEVLQWHTSSNMGFDTLLALTFCGQPLVSLLVGTGLFFLCRWVWRKGRQRAMKYREGKQP